jgi:hypothetical protein
MLGGLERADGEGKVGMVKGLMSMVLAVQFGSGASVLPFGGASFVLQKVLYHGVWSLQYTDEYPWFCCLFYVHLVRNARNDS